MSDRVGVLAVQGDFEKHLEALSRLVEPPETLLVRNQEDLDRIDRLIIPGGESTTVGLLLDRYGLGDAIKQRAKLGMPVWGTCMGMILMSHQVEGRPEQYSLDLLDVDVRRNAFGAQVHSFEDTVQTTAYNEPVLGVFIRAPIVVRLGPSVEAIAMYDSKIVGVRQDKITGTSFHPELTADTRLHEWFLTL